MIKHLIHHVEEAQDDHKNLNYKVRKKQMFSSNTLVFSPKKAMAEEEPQNLASTFNGIKQDTMAEQQSKSLKREEHSFKHLRFHE